MWPLIITAATAGLSIFSQVRQNQALKREGENALNEAQSVTELGVLKADAAYLGALSNTIDATEEANRKAAQAEATKKRLQIAAIVVGISAVGIGAIVAYSKRN